MDEDLLSISPADCVQLVKILITLEPHDIHAFASNSEYIFLHRMQSDEHQSAASRGLLVKMRITLEPHCVF